MIKGNTAWTSANLPSSLSQMEFEKHQQKTKDVPVGIYAALLRAAHKFPKKIALELETGETFTFPQLLNETQKFTSRLVALGITKDSKVSLLLDNEPNIFLALYALNQLGATAVILPGKLKSPALIELLHQSAPDLTLIEQSQEKDLNDSGHRVMTIGDFNKTNANLNYQTADLKTDDIALIMFTSGTSGRPKSVAISNGNITHAALGYELIFQLDENDKLVFGVPLYHITGVVAIIAQMTFSACTLYLQRRFSPIDFLEWSQKVGATYIHASPTVFELLLRSWPEDMDIPTVRVLACGAANMPTSRILRLKEKLPRAEFRTIYGLTETTSPATIFPTDAAHSEFIGSSGLPIPGNEIRIIDAHGLEVETGEIGEIEVRGATVCLGYLNDKGKVERIPALRTGDLGYLNEHGLLYVVDRRKDQINRGGEKIYPHIIEEALNNIDGIIDACVVSLDDNLYGEIPAAIFVAKNKISVESIYEKLKDSLASYAIPAVLLQVEEIPKTVGLKTDKGAAQELLQNLRASQ